MDRDELAVADHQADPGVLAEVEFADRAAVGRRPWRHDQPTSPGSWDGFRLTVPAMPGKPLEAGQLESGFAGLADRRATTLVLVVGRHLADPGVQPHPVVALPNQREFGAQHRRVADLVGVRPFGLDVAEQRLDPGLVGGRGLLRSPIAWQVEAGAPVALLQRERQLREGDRQPPDHRITGSSTASW
jgi:hypothetical protein